MNSVEDYVYDKLKSILSQSVKVVDRHKINARGKSYIGLHPQDGVIIDGFDYNNYWPGYGTIDCTASNDGVYVNFYDGYDGFHQGPYITRFTRFAEADFLLNQFCNEILNNLYIKGIPKN